MPFDPARLKSLFLEASDLPSTEERTAYLDRACVDEPDLRARVEALLAAEERAGPVPQTLGEAPSIASETMPGSWTLDADARPTMTQAIDNHERTAVTLGHDAEAQPTAVRAVRFVPGQVIAGRYTLVEVLGEGGMGTVYKAEQSQPVRRQVALKLIKVGMDSRTVLARFDAERQALAMMDHPNIARVYDGGVTEARQPYFVMELVQGIPITDYCDQYHLTVDARLQLFVAVCQAVQHAHQKGIIHRDLKPSNVMVTEVDGRATPKVIDFGVAKATGFDLTDQSLGDTGAIVGTPTYMSPEQADPSSMDIDTRTDVYALGVILYELLAGSTPLDATQFRRGALLEMLRMVREVDPSKPSTKVSTSDALPSIAANRGLEPGQLSRELRGDLDWIVMKALEKDRSRRYETANGFAADILRHLASEPVQAAPPSRSYRLRKFVKKHRAGVIAASLVLLTLVAGIAGTTWGLFEARRSAESERLAKLDAQANEKKAVAAAEGEHLAKIDAQDKKVLAEANEKKALAAADEEKKAKQTVEDVLEFVETKVFAAARPKDQQGGLGYNVTLAEAITAALPAIEKGFATRPLTEARLRKTIGRSFQYLSKPEIAREQFAAARVLYSRQLGPDHPETLASMNNLADSYAALGRHAEALKLNEETLALKQARLGLDDPETLTSMNNLASSYAAVGRQAEALKLHETTLALMKVKLGPDHPTTLSSMNNLALSYYARGRYAEAIKLQETTLALKQARFGLDHPSTLATMHNLAGSYIALGRHSEALKLLETTLALCKAKLGPDHTHTLQTMNSLAGSYTALARHVEALKLNEETLALMKGKLGPDHPLTLQSMNNLANCYAALGRQVEAAKLHETTLALRQAKLGPDHPGTLQSMSSLANSYAALGRQAEALKLREETLALMKAKLGPDHPNTLNIRINLTSSYVALGRNAEAIKIDEETLALMKGKLGPDHPLTLQSMANLATNNLAAGRTPEALALLEKLSAAQSNDPASSRTLAVLQAWLGQEEPYAATRKRILTFAEKTDDPSTVRLAVQAATLRPSSDVWELGAVLALGRKAVGQNKGDRELLAQGMAEFRNGRFAAADETLFAASKASNEPNVVGVAAITRAMSLFRLGKVDEARKLATETAATMKPQPQGDKNPLPGGTSPDDLVLWLVFKEAKALIGFDGPSPAPPDKPEGK